MQQERIILSITQLNAEVSQLLTQGFPALWVEGEISNFVRHSSGHLYFSLKDSSAQVRCAMFRGRTSTLKIQPKNGMKVVARGKVGLYETRGEFQMVVDLMEEAGIGALQRQFETLKLALHAQGLFADEHKQALPSFPRSIGVITSPTGAAIRDILHVLQRRCPQIPVYVYPVAVQGEGASDAVAQAIAQADQEQRCDVLIVGRGGGSIEDLWAFNEAIVAHAIFNCKTPIISGVGHEIDFTIADFVADVRAPTPSAAAELVSPDMVAYQQHLQRLTAQLHRGQQRYLQTSLERFSNLRQRLANQRPTQRLQQKAQRLDELDMRLHAALQRRQRQAHDKLAQLRQRLQTQSPLRQIYQQQEQITRQAQYLQTLMQQRLNKHQAQLSLQAGKLNALSPLATLERGYSITKTSKGELLRQTTQVKIGQTIITQLHNGTLESIVMKRKQNEIEYENEVLVLK